jgi:hypothetical protein
LEVEAPATCEYARCHIYFIYFKLWSFPIAQPSLAEKFESATAVQS